MKQSSQLFDFFLNSFLILSRCLKRPLLARPEGGLLKQDQLCMYNNACKEFDSYLHNARVYSH